MAYTAKIEGMEELDRLLDALGDSAGYVASQALYAGAGEMAKAVQESILSIQTAPFKWAREGDSRLPSPEEKNILLENGSMGIAKFEKSGSEVETSVGFDTDGYADVTWNHMSSGARTNYKAQAFKGLEYMTTSTLKKAGTYKGGVQNAKPIGVIANAINSGTSFMRKQPFFRKGVTKGTPRAKTKIIETAERLFDQIVNREKSGGKTA
jgi:hypothetical protein